MYSRTLNISTFIIVYMKEFGWITQEDGKERLNTFDIFKTYGKEYKCIFVGDASMSPHEILVPGGGNEHFNEESERYGLNVQYTNGRLIYG